MFRFWLGRLRSQTAPKAEAKKDLHGPAAYDRGFGAGPERRAPRSTEPPGHTDASGSLGEEAQTVGGPGTVSAGRSEVADQGAGAREEPDAVTSAYSFCAHIFIWDKSKNPKHGGNLRLGIDEGVNMGDGVCAGKPPIAYKSLSATAVTTSITPSVAIPTTKPSKNSRKAYS